MARPLRIQFPGAFYYISQYSNSGTPLFKSDDDRTVFLEILATSMKTYGIVLHGFVLLKNHLHLVVETPRGNLSEFMRCLNISYTSYFNRLYRRKGHLYSGRFKSIIIEKDIYLTRVSHYLHVNPVQIGVEKRRNRERKLEYLHSYKWSSLPGYLGLYPRYHFVNHRDVLYSSGGDTPQGRKNYLAEIANQLENGFLLKTKIVGQTILGSLPFIEKVHSLIGHNSVNLQLPASKQINSFLKQEKILNELERALRCERKMLLNTADDYRSITMDMLYRFAGLTNPVIGNLMGLDYTSISSGRKKLRRKRAKDPKLNAQITLIEKRLERLLTQADDQP